jgi:hypothetical protein
VLDHWTEENEPIRVTLYHVPDDNSKESRKFIGCNTVGNTPHQSKLFSFTIM